MALQEVFGVLAGILALPALGLYVYSILKYKTRPNRVTWWILALISTVVVLSYYGVGARDTLWLPIAYAASYACIGLLSLKYGDGPVSLSTIDRVALVGGMISIAIYWFAQLPLLALFLIALTEFIALVPTAVKSYFSPGTESHSAWIIGTVASFVNLFAISTWSLEIAAYPIWVFISNALILYFLIRKWKPTPTA